MILTRLHPPPMFSFARKTIQDCPTPGLLQGLHLCSCSLLFSSPAQALGRRRADVSPADGDQDFSRPQGSGKQFLQDQGNSIVVRDTLTQGDHTHSGPQFPLHSISLLRPP